MNPTASTSSTPTTTTTTAGPKAKKPRRSKVAEACRFCRRSHMSCDSLRPCGRCIKRDIAHLCTEENLVWETTTSTSTSSAGATITTPLLPLPLPLPLPVLSLPSQPLVLPSKINSPSNNIKNNNNSILDTNFNNPTASTSTSNNNNNNVYGNDLLYASGSGSGSIYNSITSSNLNQIPMLSSNFNLAMLDLASGQDGLGTTLGLDSVMGVGGDGEFQGLGLSEFLQSLNATSFPSHSHQHNHSLLPLQNQNQNSLPSSSNNQQQQSNYLLPLPGNPLPILNHEELNGALLDVQAGRGRESGGGGTGGLGGGGSAGVSVPGSPINKTERFLLTAADQKDGSRSDRLARVIHAKFEAGLLRPYNHVAGYTRLMRWMGDNMSQSSRQRTLHTLSEFRPAFRAIASGLTDLDLVFIEEAFERLLLDYDRVFSSMGIPSCLWRRTGEIYKGNKEFAALVGVPIEHLQGGKLAIYELMAEESAVNYWEKYGNIAFDAGQKAVLTSCVLINQSILSKKRKKLGGDKVKLREEAQINCCFSFTIRRDSYAIPSMIVGNFLKY